MFRQRAPSWSEVAERVRMPGELLRGPGGAGWDLRCERGHSLRHGTAVQEGSSIVPSSRYGGWCTPSIPVLVLPALVVLTIEEGGTTVLPAVRTPGPGAWRQQAVLRRLLGCWCSALPYWCSAHPPLGWGARVAFPAAETLESEQGPNPDLSCDEPACAQPTAPHRARLGGSPLLGSRGARWVLTLARTRGRTRVPLLSTGLAPAPLPFTPKEATGWRFWHTAPGTVRHCTAYTV